jgi:hypothetical protein
VVEKKLDLFDWPKKNSGYAPASIKEMLCLTDPTGYGWELEGDELVPIMTDDLPAPVGLVELSMCSCKGSCQTNRCSCYKSGWVCTGMCKCLDVCENYEKEDDNDWFLSDSDDDDDNDDDDDEDEAFDDWLLIKKII